MKLGHTEARYHRNKKPPTKNQDIYRGKAYTSQKIRGEKPKAPIIMIGKRDDRNKNPLLLSARLKPECYRLILEKVQNQFGDNLFITGIFVYFFQFIQRGIAYAHNVFLFLKSPDYKGR